MAEIFEISFGSSNVFSTQLPDSILKNLNAKSDEIKKEWNGINIGKSLAGHIKNQYSLENVKDLDDFVLKLAFIYYNRLNDQGQIQHVFTDTPRLKCSPAWINFQGPTEYNPLHNHTGLFSWVAWLKIPFDAKQEQDYFPNRPDPLNGAFQLVYQSSNGIGTHIFRLDKSYEGRLVIFPSDMHHQVYPFYSTDEYRISVAGNVHINNSVDESTSK
jgi:hypothetical protein